MTIREMPPSAQQWGSTGRRLLFAKMKVSSEMIQRLSLGAKLPFALMGTTITKRMTWNYVAVPKGAIFNKKTFERIKYTALHVDEDIDWNAIVTAANVVAAQKAEGKEKNRVKVEGAWTRESPTEGGFYWYKDSLRSAAVVLSLTYTLWARGICSERGYASQLKGWWSGPIEPPPTPHRRG